MSSIDKTGDYPQIPTPHYLEADIRNCSRLSLSLQINYTAHEVRWKKWTPKYSKITYKMEVFNGENPEREVHEGV
ncbi:hypothetical protein [Candidatus Magnetominusculus dajiuhuensis]|uniref:hypothetical protein n=1 Tax=Candidatus Magnetominusculus dajiuhuensis TaxID=3137712 RepID=UPI003B434642